MESKKIIIKKLYCKRNPVYRIVYFCMALMMLHLIIRQGTELIARFIAFFPFLLLIYMAFFSEKVAFIWFYKQLSALFEELPKYEINDMYIMEKKTQLKIYYPFFCGCEVNNECILLYIDRFFAIPVFPENFDTNEAWLQYSKEVKGKVIKRQKPPNYGAGWKTVLEKYNMEMDRYNP